MSHSVYNLVHVMRLGKAEFKGDGLINMVEKFQEAKHSGSGLGFAGSF